MIPEPEAVFFVPKGDLSRLCGLLSGRHYEKMKSFAVLAIEILGGYFHVWICWICW